MWWFSKLSIYILLFESILIKNSTSIETTDYDNNAIALANFENIIINGKCLIYDS